MATSAFWKMTCSGVPNHLGPDINHVLIWEIRDLTNGYKIEGAVREFDYSSVVVEVKGRPQMVLRQGIVS